VICSLPFSNRDSNKEIGKWIKDINDFKSNCKSKKKKDIYADPDVQKAIAEALSKKMHKKLKNSRINDALNKDSMNKQLKMAQLLALKSLDKELKYEERMEKEESMREEKEKEELKKQLLCEEKKKENLIKALILKSAGSQLKNKIEMKKKLKMIHDDLKDKVMRNRKMLEEKLYRMKKIHERKISNVKNQINDIRFSLTESMIKAEKKGDMKQCKSDLSQNDIEGYCNSSFQNDFYLNIDCKKKSDFCSICCENEFGEMHQKERELCYAQCEVKIQFQNPKGKWIYVSNDEVLGNSKKSKSSINDGSTVSVALNNNLPI